MRELLAAAALLASGALSAATLGGRLGFPGEELPAMMVVARDAAGRTFAVETRPGQRRYRLEVPAGTYAVFAMPIGIPPTPGQLPLRGAHTQYSICGRDAAKLGAGACRTGPLVEIRVEAADKREDVDVDDWYMPDALVATLNLQIRDASPAPAAAAEALFAALPADTNPLPATRPPDFAGAPPQVQRARARIQRVATRGPYFAGRFAVASWECGRRCANWALVDMASGKITWIEALQPLRRDYPCDAAPLEFREDSRLLRVHRSEGGEVVTQDLVWSAQGERLDQGARSAQSAEQFCAARR